MGAVGGALRLSYSYWLASKRGAEPRPDKTERCALVKQSRVAIVLRSTASHLTPSKSFSSVKSRARHLRVKVSNDWGVFRASLAKWTRWAPRAEEAGWIWRFCCVLRWASGPGSHVRRDTASTGTAPIRSKSGSRVRVCLDLSNVWIVEREKASKTHCSVCVTMFLSCSAHKVSTLPAWPRVSLSSWTVTTKLVVVVTLEVCSLFFKIVLQDRHQGTSTMQQHQLYGLKSADSKWMARQMDHYI